MSQDIKPVGRSGSNAGGGTAPDPVKMPPKIVVPRGIEGSPPPPDMSVSPPGDSTGGGSAGKRRRGVNRQWLKGLGIVSVLITLLAVFSFVMASAWYDRQMMAAAGGDNRYVVISIPAGSSTVAIAELLESKQIIRSARAFHWHVRLNSDKVLQAGDYRLAPQQSVQEIVEVLSSGEVATIDVMVPPGLRLDEVLAILQKAGYSKDELDEALLAIRDHPLIVEANIAKGDILEGYLFPDTYKIGAGTSAEELMRLMLDHFQSQIDKEGIGEQLKQQGLTLLDAVIIASIVQKEVPDYPTQQKVAQVFLKRYKEGNPLGADPTFKYAAAMTGQQALPNLDSPYNTRKYSGLPPTPIANFNISALKAVVNPSNTNYHYFVSGDDGVTHFTHTLQEHEAATKRYCTTLCQ